MIIMKNHFDGFCHNFSNPHNLQQTLFFWAIQAYYVVSLIEAFGDSRVT
jgi:hypothetical protein